MTAILELTQNDHGTLYTCDVSASVVGAQWIKADIGLPDGTVLTKDAEEGDNPAAGNVQWTWAEGDLAQEGFHRVQVRVKFSNDAEQTFDQDTSGRPILFWVNAELG